MKNLGIWLLCELALIIFIVLVGVITYKLEGDVVTPICLLIFMTIGNYGAYIDRKDSAVVTTEVNMNDKRRSIRDT